MSLSSVNAQIALSRRLVELRQTMMDLQRQLGSGKKAETYGGLGSDRALSLTLRARLSTMEGQAGAGRDADLRIGLLEKAVSRVGALGDETRRDATLAAVDGSLAASVSARNRAQQRLHEMVTLLNTEVAGRHLLSGAATDTRPVVDAGLLLDGDATRAGLRRLTAERREADTGGAGGLGRLAVSAVVADSVDLAEDGVHPFGFKIATAATSSPAVTVTDPAGTPPSRSIAFTAQPAEGAEIRIGLVLPDGSQETVTLKATSDPSAAGDVFAVGATVTDTADNFRAVLVRALENRAAGALAAASGLQAASELFTSGGAAPLRVSGPPFATATALVAGTPADTVSWYAGDDAPTDPRATATAQVDRGITAAYGARANEAPLAATAAAIAALAADDFGGAGGPQRYEALMNRLMTRLEPNGPTSVAGIVAELAGAQQTVRQAEERRAVEGGALRELIDQVEGTVPEDVAAKLLTLQTRLQASYETTAMLSRMSLIHHL